MTGSATTNPTLLSDKLSLVTHHRLLTRVPVKLDLDEWNYGSWEYFFDQLCDSYEISKFIHGNSCGTTTSDPPPLTPEEIKVDKIILSWIFTTLSDVLQKRLVNARPKFAKEAWDFIGNLVKDNKRSRTSALKTELRSIKLGDLSMEAYFQKIESLMTILASLDSPVSDDDVVHYVLAGLPEKYNQVCGYMHYQTTFPDFKTVRSLLTTEEMRLKSTSLASHVDSSSSPMVLLADSCTSRRPSNPQVKSWWPCFNFAKGSCRFGSECRCTHDATVKPHTSNSKQSHNSNSTNALLSKLLEKLGMHESGPNKITNTHTVTTPSAHYMTPPPGFTYSPAQQQLVHYQPTQPIAAHASIPAGPTLPSQPAHVQPAAVAGSVQQAQPSAPPGFLIGPADNTGQATTLPQAFTAGTLHDPTTGAWIMDTGFPEASSASPL
ncbi:ribonuclease H-like domain-containing protein [Tanacetum coccineum]